MVRTERPISMNANSTLPPVNKNETSKSNIRENAVRQIQLQTQFYSLNSLEYIHDQLFDKILNIFQLFCEFLLIFGQSARNVWPSTVAILQNAIIGE